MKKLYRIDRMIVQIAQAGLLDGAAAIVLGDFTNCDDESNTCLPPVQPIEAAPNAFPYAPLFLHWRV